MVSSNKTPRGLRNNNPLNIRIGNVWLGEVDNPTDSAFEQFKTIEYGLRAGFIILRRYIRRYNKRTIREIISTWAPSNENNTKAYINSVCSTMKRDAEEKLRFEDKPTMCALVDAMIRVECGQAIDMKYIQKGYDMT